MKIEIKDLADVMGVEITEETTREEFINSFNNKFVPAENHNKKIKEINARAAHAINKSFRDAGFEVTKEEVEKVDLFELPSVYASKVTAKLTELESNKSATEEEIAKKYEKELTTYKTKAADLSGLLEETKTGFEQFKSEVQTKEKNFAINTYKSNAMSQLNWSDNANEFVKKGFEATINEKYRFELDDENKPIVRDKDGKVIASTVKAGDIATYEEVIKSEFSALKDFQKVTDSKKVPTFANRATVTGATQVQPKRYVRN